MANANEQREAVKKSGRTREWWARVDKMPEDQITAIYLRLKNAGKL